MVAVDVSVYMQQTDPLGQQLALTLFADGCYRQEGHAHVLQYESTDLSGADKHTVNLRIHNGAVYFDRLGPADDARQSAEIELVPISMEYDIHQAQGDVRMAYQLKADGQIVATNHLHVHFTPSCP